MSISLTRFLPGPWRMFVEGALHSARAARGSMFGALRPAAESRHSEEQLRAFSRDWARRREARGLDGQPSMLWELEVSEVLRPTADAITLRFANPGPPLSFRPGQFLQFQLDIDGDTHRRAYSLCSCPTDGFFSVTIKRVEGGLVSNYLNDRVERGWKLKAQGPLGRFGTEARPEARRQVVLVAAGAGITPLFSIVQDLLKREPQSHVTLVYANRRRQDILFRQPLDDLAEAYPERLCLSHHLSSEGQRLEGDRLIGALPISPQAEYYLCGPLGFMDDVTGHLRGAGVSASQIARERFVSQRKARGQGEVYAVRFASLDLELQVPDHQTLLEAGRGAGLDMDFSCQMGGCAACMVQILEGTVEMEEPHCLSEAERAAGYCLACIARPTSPVVLK